MISLDGLSILDEWRPAASKDLVRFEEDIFEAFCLINLIRARPQFVIDHVFGVYGERFVHLQGQNYLLNGFGSKV